MVVAPVAKPPDSTPAFPRMTHPRLLLSGPPSRRCRPALAVVGVLLAFASLGLTGCGHYQLGTGTSPAFASLYLEPVANRTPLPQAQALLSTRLREAFARDNRIALVNSPDAAEATLSIAITDYRREVATVREDDTGLARKFNITLEVTCTLHDQHGRRPVFAGRVVGVQREIFTDSGQLQAEYQLLPLLAESLARKLVHTVLDRW